MSKTHIPPEVSNRGSMNMGFANLTEEQKAFQAELKGFLKCVQVACSDSALYSIVARSTSLEEAARLVEVYRLGQEESGKRRAGE